MGLSFSDAERRILSMFQPGTKFYSDYSEFLVVNSGKPVSSRGEPKTDIYIAARNRDGHAKEFKISFKKENADFLENKTNPERAEQLLGKNWSSLITNATKNIEHKFYKRHLIYKNKHRRTEEGAITLGWKFELLNKLSGDLSGSLDLSREQVIDVYSGTNLNDDKKDASVGDMKISGSGVANYILNENHFLDNPQQIINSLITVEEFVDQNPKVYFACKALNYRTFTGKYDGNRPLAVYVDWNVKKEKLVNDIRFDTPLMQGGNFVYNKLKQALQSISVKTTKQLDYFNVKDLEIIYR